MIDASSKKFLKVGIIGTIIVALCCFTPILVILLGVVGLSAAVGYLDYILLPALFIFVGITIYALSKRKQEGCCAKKQSSDKGEMGDQAKQKVCCDSTWPESKHPKPAVCPVSAEKGQSVETKTLRHLLKKEYINQVKGEGFYFCKTPDCDIVYFHPQNGQSFAKKDLMVRVGFKETEDPVWVCYCFDISKKMIAAEIEKTGDSASGDRIRREVANKNCACEIKNPSGRCCLGEVLAAEKEAKKMMEKDVVSSTDKITSRP